MNVLCEEYMRQFDNALATVLQKQTFAECVRTVYPLASGVAETQVIVWFVTLGVLLSLYVNREYLDDALDFFVFMLIGSFIGAFSALLVLAVVK